MEDVWLISSFVFYRKSWLTRLLLLFDGKIKYNSLESNYYLEKIVKGEIGFPRFSYQALMPFTVCEGL